MQIYMTIIPWRRRLHCKKIVVYLSEKITKVLWSLPLYDLDIFVQEKQKSDPVVTISTHDVRHELSPIYRTGKKNK